MGYNTILPRLLIVVLAFVAWISCFAPVDGYNQGSALDVTSRSRWCLHGVKGRLGVPCAVNGLRKPFWGSEQSYEKKENHILFSAIQDEAAVNNRNMNKNDNPFHLPPELLKMASAFASIGDDRLRHKQLLYMAAQLAPLDPRSAILENKVPGCLSTVYVDATIRTVSPDEGNGDSIQAKKLIYFTGDSDGLLTKGLVALLVRGLSGSTAEQIEAVDPAFVKKAGIAASLTPGRNNGFLNMLAAMKRKARALSTQDSTTTTNESWTRSDGIASSTSLESSGETKPTNNDNEQPIYSAMVKALGQLKPVTMELRDVSYQHAGHAEARRSSNIINKSGKASQSAESHFELDIVADAFDGLNLVQRHKLIYMILGDIMPQIHALQIRAKASSEVSNKQ